MTRAARLLVHPETCAVLRLETGIHVGKTETQSTLIEWPSDARYFRYADEAARVKRLSGLESAEKALEVREDELLASGYVKIDQPQGLAELLGHHDPWKTWHRAKGSSAVLTELWKGLAPPERLERASGGVAVTAVTSEHVILRTPSGALECERPLHPGELGEAPSFLIPLLARHASMAVGRDAAFQWDPLEGLILGAGEVEFQYTEDGLLSRTTPRERAVVPAALGPVMEFVLERLVGAR